MATNDLPPEFLGPFVNAAAARFTRHTSAPPSGAPPAYEVVVMPADQIGDRNPRRHDDQHGTWVTAWIFVPDEEAVLYRLTQES